jgi:hypothetical protein
MIFWQKSASCNNGRRRCIAECLRNRHAASCPLTWNGEMQLQAFMLLQARGRRLWLNPFILSAILRSRVSGKRNFDGQTFNNALSIFLTTHRAVYSLYSRSLPCILKLCKYELFGKYKVNLHVVTYRILKCNT